MVAAFATTVGYIRHAWHMFPLWPDATNRVEYRVTDWLAKNPGDVLALLTEITKQNRKINADTTGAYLKSLAQKWVPKAIDANTIDTVAKAAGGSASITTGMVLGAGWCGARSMTSTSGPGISLMAEFAGLGYYTEVPGVIWNIQRVGPSTGLPTRTAIIQVRHSISSLFPLHLTYLTSGHLL